MERLGGSEERRKQFCGRVHHPLGITFRRPRELERLERKRKWMRLRTGKACQGRAETAPGLTRGVAATQCASQSPTSQAIGATPFPRISDSTG